MNARSANVTSVDAVRAFRLALQQFDTEANAGLVAFEMEARRAIDWIANDRARYWPREEKRASDLISEARMALSRAEITAGEGEHKSFVDEKKALERAKRRQQLAEEKTRVVKRWRQVIEKEVDEFLVQVSKMKTFLDTDLLRTQAGLERMIGALDRYVQQLKSGGAANDDSALPSTTPAAHESNSEPGP